MAINTLSNKRGMFFTVIALVMLSLFLLTFTAVSHFSKIESEQRRVETLEGFVSSTERDLPRYLGISSYRIFFLLEKEVVQEGNYVSNLQASFSEGFFNGTVRGSYQELMRGATFSEIQDSLRNHAAKINANLSLFNPQVSVTQDDPWNVKIILRVGLFAEDFSGLVIWNKTLDVVSHVPIENFDDPLYLMNTNSLVAIKMRKSPYVTFVSGSDVSNLSSHLDNSFYVSSTSAPSYLDRLQGINAPNPYGIESLVDLRKLASQGIDAKDKSVVDYIYFSSANPSACAVIPTGMPSWFKLDNEHLSAYQVSCA